ncbi:MAG: hypothetical protein ACFFB0_06495 [Promethearchaeota archaeon]
MKLFIITNNQIEEIQKLIKIEIDSYYSKCKKPNSYSQIAKDLGFSPPTIRKYAKRYLIREYGENGGLELYNQYKKLSRKTPNKWTYEYLQELAKRRGLEENNIEGKLITTKDEFFESIKSQYPSGVKLKWWCGKKNHDPWETSGSEVKRSWCPRCFRERVSFSYSYLHALAKKRGFEETRIEGILITNRKEFARLIKKGIEPSKIKLKWCCCIKDHNPWEASAKDIKGYNSRKGSWCPRCAIEKNSLSYEDLRALAKKRGIEETGIKGTLITSKQKFEKLAKRGTEPSKTKLKWWCCNKDHEPWKATPNSISRGTWCPYCSQGKYERICRRFFQIIFKEKFRKISLSNLIKDSDIKMHLDGYAKVNIHGKLIKLAFEYNGYQHYIWPNVYHNTVQKFLEQQDRDILKRKICEENGIILIEFPYKISPRMKEPEKIKNFIISGFENKTGIKLPKLQ